MRLGELIGRLSPERIEDLCKRLVPGGEELSPHSQAHSLESLLRDSGFIEHTLNGHRPPVLGILRELLEARNHRVSLPALRATTLEATEVWSERVAGGTLAARDPMFRIYRRLLAAAWDNDLRLDASERTLLGLLRREVGMSAIEHFLISHHPDIQPYWKHDDYFDRELTALIDNGVVYLVDGDVVIPEDFVTRVQKALGLFLSRGAALRLLSHLSNEDLRSALERYGVRKGGDKSELISRIIDDLVPMPDVLAAAAIGELQDVARAVGASPTGSKDELITRLMDHFERGADLRVDEEAQVFEQAEPKELTEHQFKVLLSGLSGHQLEQLCRRHELRHGGSKEVRILTLWESLYGERTLLKSLRNPDLSELCGKHELDTAGAKDAMVERLIGAFRSASTR